MESSRSAHAQLGKYTLVAEMARGGMGIVYLAQMSGHAGFQKLVVIKHLKPELAEDEKFRGMFLDEARLAARLNHRNIVQTNEVGEDEGAYFMAMEYLEGRPLQSARNRLKGDKALTRPMVLRIACEVLSALHYAHELTDYEGKVLKIVHRDVSPQNVFLTYDGQVKLLDFGVAKATGNAQETQAGMLKGRVVCMSPEHVGNDDVDRRADIFSMGVMLRELLTSTRLWDGMNEMEVLKELLARRIPPFPDDTDVADDLRAIVEKAMAVHRNNRFSTAQEMRIAIEEHLSRVDPSNVGSLAKVGEILSREYAEQRDRVRTTVEQHIANASAVSSHFPEIELPMFPQSSPDLTPSHPNSAVSRAGTGSGAKSASATTMGPVVASEAPTPSIPASTSRRSKGLTLAIGVVVVGLAIGGTALLTRRGSSSSATNGDDRQQPTTTQPAAALASPPPPPTSADIVELTVRATPASAQIFIDDAVVNENPWHAKYPRGGQHSIRVVAPGHAPKSESITLSESTNMSFSLDKQQATVITVGQTVAAAPAVPRTTPARATTPATPSTEAKPSNNAAPTPPPVTTTAASPASDINQGGGKAPKRSINQKNPYQ